MSDLPPTNEQPDPELDLGAPVVCKKCTGDPRAHRHTKGCPNVSEESRKREARKVRAGAARPSSPSRPGKYTRPLMDYAGSVGTLLTVAGTARQSPHLVYDGEVILHTAEPWAKSLDALAAENPRVAAVFDSMLTTGAWSAVIISTAGMLVPILACHRILPPQAATIFGMPEPPPPPVRPEWSEDAGTEVPPTDWPVGTAAGNGHPGTHQDTGGPVPPMEGFPV